MEDKFSNIVIILMIIVILVLGGIYYAKVAQSQAVALKDMPTYNDRLEDGVLTNETNDTNSTNNTENYNVNDIVIPGVEETNIYSQTTSGYPYNNRYYYNELNEYSKVIYDAFVKELDNLKYGNCTIELDYDFSELLSNEEGQHALEEYYNDAVNALNLDIPNIFYIDFSKMYLNIETTSSIFSKKYKLYIDSGDFSTYFTSDFVTNSQVALAIKQVESNKNQFKEMASSDAYLTIKRIHDKLVNDMTYDGTGIQKASVYGALIERKGVCESYARTFKYILDELGIENVLVTGKGTNSTGATEDHMWNYVKLDGFWYAVDVTWDDPIVSGGAQTDEMRHKYFLKGSGTFLTNHEESLNISTSGKVFNPPVLATRDY